MAQPAHVATDAGVAAPYGMCEASPNVPADAGVIFDRSRAHTSFDEPSTKTARSSGQKVCCYTWVIPCPGGRAHRGADGEPVLAAVVPRTDWIDASVIDAIELLGVDRDGLAERWKREAQFEHASIAEFAHVTLDLLALGAPAALVEAAQRAGLDEVRHARIAFSIASAYAGKSLGPGPLPVRMQPRAPTLEEVVREAIRDGCIGEAAAALMLREEASRTKSPALRALFEAMADDEERHAELAYMTVAWARAQDSSVARAIAEELARPEADAMRARVLEQVARPCLLS